MTNKQVIEHIKLLLDKTSNITLFNKTVFEKVIQALEKQEPMKVLDIETGTLDIDVYVAYGVCPNCKVNINEVADENYCGNCGQALDWSDDND